MKFDKIIKVLKKIRALIIGFYYIIRYGEEEGYKRIMERVQKNVSKMSPEELNKISEKVLSEIADLIKENLSEIADLIKENIKEDIKNDS